eukprot:gene3744-4152_t
MARFLNYGNPFPWPAGLPGQHADNMTGSPLKGAFQYGGQRKAPLRAATVLVGAAMAAYIIASLTSSMWQEPPRFQQVDSFVQRGYKGLHIVTVLSKPYREYCQMLESAIHNGFLVHIIGWGDADFQSWNHNEKEAFLKLKIVKARKYIEEHFSDDDEHVMVVDGGDVLFNRGADYIISSFRHLATQPGKAGGRDIVFSAEKNCWIRSLPDASCHEWAQPPGGQPLSQAFICLLRYLNSGCWLGRVGPVKSLLEGAAKEFDQTTCEKVGCALAAGQPPVAGVLLCMASAVLVLGTMPPP